MARVTISVLRVPAGLFSFSRLTPPRALSRLSARPSLAQRMLVGGEEKSLMEQVREMELPGLTNTLDSAWMTAVAAAMRRNHDLTSREMENMKRAA